MEKPSKIFTGFRALGFVSNHVPLCVRYHQRHKENYAVTAVGKSFHVYNCSKLGIISVSDAHPEPISCMAVDGAHIYTASGKTIQAFSRGRKVKHTYSGHQRPIQTLLPFGEHLISVDDSSLLIVWDVISSEVFLEVQFSRSTFDVTTIVHPNTYVNKVLLGSRQGALQLWNLRTNKQLYNFIGWSSPVTVLEQAPAVDVIAVGLADGRTILHNIRYDEELMTFTQDWGPVTAISFRTDGHPIMVTGSPLGHLALWNLEERKLQSQMRDAHAGTVTGLRCLPSEPLMVSSSPDNSLKVWIFDLPDGGGRLLRQRCGHSAPPTRARHYDSAGHTLLTAAQDSTLQAFSTVHDRHNKSLGRASYNKKETKKAGLKLDQHRMPPVVDFAAEPSRQSDWDSIAAVHRGEKVVTTWNYKRSTMGAHRLVHKRFSDPEHVHSEAKCVDISSCGNFTVIGYSSGHVDVYNIQSGIHRGSYGDPSAHSGCVRGVAIDSLNQVIITAGADKKVKFWKFKGRQLMQAVETDSQVSQILLHRESAMLAVALDDFEVLILDIDTRRIVRKFAGHSNKITDMTFSPDSRWLITSSMDATVRTWDLPTGRLVDCYVVDRAVTSLSLSPTCDFLVTTHVDDLGVYTWSNMSLYTHVDLRPLPADYEPRQIEMPGTARLSGAAEDPEELADTEQYEGSEFKSPEQISGELVTLSLLPNSRWLSLINLDVIKMRNKPKQPPKVPKAAPFFLPTIAGLTPKFAPAPEEAETDEKSHIIKGHLLPLSKFAKTLQDASQSGKYVLVRETLRSLGPSAVDTELRTLGPEGGGSVALMAAFLHFINASLNTNRDFELVQAYLGLFLKLHSDVISQEPSLVEACQQIQKTQERTWDNIETLCNQSLCLLNYIKSAAL